MRSGTKILIELDEDQAEDLVAYLEEAQLQTDVSHLGIEYIPELILQEILVDAI